MRDPFVHIMKPSESARHRLRSGAAAAGNGTALGDRLASGGCPPLQDANEALRIFFMLRCENGWKHGDYRPGAMTFLLKSQLRDILFF